MNYRHIFHAGNFADVFKHWVLTLLLEKFLEKPAPFCVIDTHAGLGLYQIKHADAQKTQEYAAGIDKLITKEVDRHFKTYFKIVKDEYTQNKIYLGSPKIIQALLRPTDRLFLSELHPQDYAGLAENFKRDRRVKTLHQDAYQSIKALLPSKETRCLILIDPPFEVDDEFDQIITAVTEGLKRMASGVFVIWYPIAEPRAVERFYRQLAKLPIKNGFYIELHANAKVSNKLNSCGLAIINPPWKMDQQLKSNMPKLIKYIELENGEFSLKWFKQES